MFISSRVNNCESESNPAESVVQQQDHTERSEEQSTAVLCGQGRADTQEHTVRGPRVRRQSRSNNLRWEKPTHMTLGCARKSQGVCGSVLFPDPSENSMKGQKSPS